MQSYFPWRKAAPNRPLPARTSAVIALRDLLPEQERQPAQDAVVYGPERPPAAPALGQLVELERPASKGPNNPRYISMEAMVQEHQRRAEAAEAEAAELRVVLDSLDSGQAFRYGFNQPAPTMAQTVAGYPMAAIYGIGNALYATPRAIINAPWTLASGAHSAATSVANTYGRFTVWWSKPTTPETPINFRTVEEAPSYQHTKRFARSAGTGNRERGIVLHASKDEFFYIPHMLKETGAAISFTSRYDRETLSLVYMPDGLGAVQTLNNQRTLQLFDAQCLSTVNDLIAQITHAQSVSSRSVWYPTRAAGWNGFVTSASAVTDAVLTVTTNVGIFNPKIVAVILGAAIGVVGLKSAFKTLAIAGREWWHLSNRRKVEDTTKRLLEGIWKPFINGAPNITSEITENDLRQFKLDRPNEFTEKKKLQMHYVVHETLTVALQSIREREDFSGVPFAQWRKQAREQGQAVASSVAGPSFAHRRNVQQITEGEQQ